MDAIARAGYSVRRNLLVRFTDDELDQSVSSVLFYTNMYISLQIELEIQILISFNIMYIAGYSVRRNLLVRFTDDELDQSVSLVLLYKDLNLDVDRASYIYIAII